MNSSSKAFFFLCLQLNTWRLRPRKIRQINRKPNLIRNSNNKKVVNKKKMTNEISLHILKDIVLRGYSYIIIMFLSNSNTFVTQS